MSTRSRLLFAIGVAAGMAGLLVDFQEAATQLAALWPAVGALLPVFALGCGAVGLAMIGESVWRWHAPRRPRERFQRLEPRIRACAETLHTDPVTATHGLRMTTDCAATIFELQGLGVGMPHDEEDLVVLLVCAEQGRLDVARRMFPSPAE